jgi:hypothetical protein
MFTTTQRLTAVSLSMAFNKLGVYFVAGNVCHTSLRKRRENKLEMSSLGRINAKYLAPSVPAVGAD